MHARRALWFAHVLLCAAVFAVTVGSASSAFAQEKDADKPPAWKVDPYSGSDPEVMAAAGYVSFGPFPFGDNHDTLAIERTLGTVKLIWVETKHFRIGSALPSYDIPSDKKVRARIAEELKRLKTKLPKVKPATRTLDPWLRLHLTAQRCEEFYEDFTSRLQVTADDFPQQSENVPPERYRGEGPYLGMRDKFTILLVDKISALARYGERFLGGAQQETCRHLFVDHGGLFVGMALERSHDGRNRSDTELHCQLTFNLVHNMVSGFRFFWYQLPVWLPEGLAHWYQRRIEPEFLSFSGLNEDAAAARRDWNWPPRVRARLRHDHFKPTETMLTWFDFAEVSFADHMMMWSRVDYLMEFAEGGLARYLKHMKGKIPAAGLVPTNEEILARQKEAFPLAFGMQPAELDLAWKKHVLATYPTK